MHGAEEIQGAIKEVHEGQRDSVESKSLRSHHGIAATINLVASRFYWRMIMNDIEDYVKSCPQCQLVNPKFIKEVPQLHSIAVPKAVMVQIGIDISCLPEPDGYKYIVLAIDYFSKWSEGKALKDKSAGSVARFLFEFICRHGCIDIQINDQGREFVNQVSMELHCLTGVEQHMTSAYHPQVIVKFQHFSYSDCDQTLMFMHDNF